MTKEELLYEFDDFVVRNGKRASSLVAFKALDKLSNVRNGIRNRTQSHKGLCAIIHAHNDELFSIIPSPKSQYYEKESLAYKELINYCNNNQYAEES